MDGFVLGPVMAALDKVEFDGAAVGDALSEVRREEMSVHPGVRRYAEHATRMYLENCSHEDEELRPVQESWIVQRVLPSVVWELYAWGRRYEAPDGGLREFRFLRLGPARERSPAEIAIAAFVAAFGTPAAWPKPWSEPFQPSGRAGAKRVRVLEVGLVDGSVKLFLDATADDVEA